ncbi:Crp/Fnr family transcriptional regulator [Novosphingobium malaysiense]|uniref:HTH crp-type domain-containing protein n=1 Tax=Novosphingobium malaysiense TaxID=1348853 RepID=A0A0B1ZMB5_9SPHN|nr:Crp/Fnr family transcriptional regulator [Novosphingobium malaysiense]KHK92260.1 hypothetical protein LK12_05310 [Novosphingobium malaysiense]
MTANTPERLDNAVLAALPAEARAFLAARLLTKRVMSGEVLHESGAPIIHLVFPHRGIGSIQAIMQDGRSVESASVGREGVVGIEYLLGKDVSPYHATVAISGEASWVTVADMEAAMAQFPAVREIMRQYCVRMMRDLMQAVACASVHSASQRVATWLMRAEDRTCSSQLELTQRTLANIFGLRLATISDACGRLNVGGAIDQARGTLTIVNRERLADMSCECYRRYASATLL